MSTPDQDRSEHERRAAVEIVAALRRRDHLAYLAGGCVRDLLFGERPKDYDVATDARPEQIESYFRKTAAVGAAFGVMLVRDYGSVIEVASFRSDGVYSDARRPDSIEFAGPKEDAERRDFTINALFMDPLSEPPDAIIDFVDGRKDVENRILRAVGDPAQRFNEDHLRALRAVRFAARFDLTIEPSTRSAISEQAQALRGVSVERIGNEMERMLGHHTRCAAGVLIDELGLDDAILGDVHGFDPAVMNRLGKDASYPLALAALAIGRGHEIDASSAALCEQYRARLDLSNSARSELCHVLEIASAFHTQWDSLGLAQRRRLAGRTHAQEAMDLYSAWCREHGQDHDRAIIEQIEQWKQQPGGVRPKALISGSDLIELGFVSGPRLGKALESIYDAQLEGRISTKSEALALASLVESDSGPDPAYDE